MMCHCRIAIVVVSIAVLLAACGNDEIHTITVPKGQEAIGDNALAPRPTPPTHDTIAPADEEARPWTAPAHWRENPDNPPMRLATYLTDGPAGTVEIAITRFAGDVGGMLANVNRWRGQIGLPPIIEDELADLIEPFNNPGFAGHVMHLRGPDRHMLAASIHETAADRTWFVRVIGDEATCEAVEQEVFDFARSFGRSATE